MTCPKHSLALGKKFNALGYAYAQFDSKKGCVGCAFCAALCPGVAIQVY